MNQATAAVNAAKAAGGTPADVRAILEHFDQHRNGWGEYPEVILYRRLQSFSQAHRPGDGWPALSDEYKRRVAAQASLKESLALGKHTLERRPQNQQARQHASRRGCVHRATASDAFVARANVHRQPGAARRD